MKKIIYTRGLLICAGLLAASCAEDYKETIALPAKPVSVELDERLASYDVLSEYASKAGITLGVAVASDEFAAKGMPFGIVRTNFGQIESNTKVSPIAMWTSESTYNLASYATLVSMARDNGFDLFGPVLCAETNIPDDYLKSIIADEVIPYEPWSEQILITDFEDVAVGTKYPSQKKTAASSKVTVVEDPLGKQGKVLGGTELTMDVPMVANVKLPAGTTLADLSRLRLKCLLTSGTPTASRLQILSAGNNEKGNPYTVKNEWQDFVFDLTAIKFSEADLKANTISIAVGCYGSKVVCYVDDIYVQLEHRTGDDTVISKTPEEKTALINGELNRWVESVTETCGTDVKKYIIYDEPLDAEMASFHWTDYLPETYVKGVQDAVKAVAGDDARFYVSQTMTLGEMMPVDVAALKTEIANIEKTGVKVDGVNIVLDGVYYEDYSAQVANDEETVEAIKS
ncbi:MAG: hypothetical protein K2K77_05990, partial [Duncaniella sp.]|nr:hypothetical protein [Duncaniella sp.]